MQNAVVEYSDALNLSNTLFGALERKSSPVVAVLIIGKSVGNLMRNPQQFC